MHSRTPFFAPPHSHSPDQALPSSIETNCFDFLKSERKSNSLIFSEAESVAFI